MKRLEAEGHIEKADFSFIYDPQRPIPKTEAVKSLESAEQFVQEIVQRIEKLNPQKRLME